MRNNTRILISKILLLSVFFGIEIKSDASCKLAAFISSHHDVLCYGDSDGSATVSDSGGTAPYTYLWTPTVQMNATAVDLSAGSYTVVVTDKNGCTATAIASISQPPQLALSYTQTNPLCNGECTGDIHLILSGGTPPYWYGGSTSSLCAGTYNISITDNNGCTAIDTVVIKEPPKLIVTVDSLIMSGCNSAAWVNVTGGSPQYSYSWTPVGQTSDTAKNLCSGTYTITVTDSNGCTATSSVEIPIITGFPQLTNTNIEIFPNPSNGVFLLSFQGICEYAEITLYNTLGEVVTKKIIKNKNSYCLDISDTPNGIYYCRIISNEGNLIGRGKLIKF